MRGAPCATRIAALARLPQTRARARARACTAARPVDAGGPDYINAVAQVRHARSTAPELLAQLQALELPAGRERPYRNAPRTLDLDLLLYGDGAHRQPDADRAASAHARARLRAAALAEIAPERVPAAELAAVAQQRIAPLPPASSPA